MNVRYSVCAALLVCVALPALAQQHAQMTAVAEPLALAPSPAPIVPSRAITLDVVVAGKSGVPVAGLLQQNFTILDDKQPQTVTSFQPIQLSSMKADSPVEIILLIDSLNTRFNNVSYERKQIDKFLMQNDGHLATPMSIIFLSDLGAQTLQGATRDGNLLVKALDQKETSTRTIHKSGGFFSDEELVQYSLNALSSIAAYESKKPGRKMLIWISPGWPLIAGPNIDLTYKEKQQVFDSIVSTSNELRQARITLYNIDPLGMEDAGRVRTVYYREFLKGVADPSHAMPPNLSLQVLASQSGGRVLNSSNGIAEEIASCAQDANAFYILSFDPTPVAHPNQYRTLEVKIDQPGLIARTRTGYYGLP